MRNITIKLYSLAAPLALLPVMGFGFDQVGPYVKGPEFRSFLAEILTQIFSGVVGAFFTALMQGVFGVLG